ncbi:uncharacterized protein BO80DRAFT_458890 [Aspergillus ibericus CBS 121593]|uniref:DUF7702 domain-containing protein n=1 Tax=Aspergillus ibericus CBS 121593 TaxID=1448316 RepID=A0A395GMN7_9EURO|nr:hypothetical protein BO80DRAFT_458890 [Aspergillus ibericus CBS 121593]RAK96586.1 hypothetical protein BO80DRAFT_458890 [Aspergillus ibericus CBS 121593]
MTVTVKGVAIAELVVYIPTALVTLLIDGSISSSSAVSGSFDEICQHGPSDPGSRHNVLLHELSSVSGIARKLVGIYSQKATAISGRSKVVQLLHIPCLTALILSIIGGTDQASSNPSDQAGGKTETRVGIIIFLAVYIVLCILWITTIKDLSRMVSSQKRIVAVMLMALPLIACRLLYSLISDFSHDRRFSLVSGDVTIRLCMATIEEFLVVLMYTVLGIITPRYDANAPSSPQQWPHSAEDTESQAAPGGSRGACDHQKYAHVGHEHNGLPR